MQLLEPGERDKLIVSVFDNGVGIKEDSKASLFQLFGTLSDSRKMNA